MHQQHDSSETKLPPAFRPQNIDAINELRWKKFPLLSDGFVCLVDCMGDDNSITQAARISYGNHTKEKSESENRTLIRYLLRHSHTTPFEMAEIKLLVRAPMDCWRQWIRHRTANVNEYSTRYSEAINSFDTTPPNEWRHQSKSNKQGSEHGEFLSLTDGNKLSESESKFHEIAETLYEIRLEAGVAREQARKDLPLSTYTEAYWKCDLHNIFNFLRLRMDKHAQKEIREYAEVIGKEIVAKLFPVCWEAFEDYILDAVKFTAFDIALMQTFFDAYGTKISEKEFEAITKSLQNTNNREVAEALDKFKTIGFVRA